MSRTWTRWDPLDFVGTKARLVLVRNLHRVGLWEAMCLGCETVKVGHSVALGHVACLPCTRLARGPKCCVTCGTTDEKRFDTKVRACMACDRAACRNGRHACGRAIRKTRHPPWSVLPCLCGAP